MYAEGFYDWKESGVNSIRGWCNKVKDRDWLASMLREGRKKKGSDKVFIK